MNIETMSRADLEAALRKLLCTDPSVPTHHQAVLVTTAHRGVFFGYAKLPEDLSTVTALALHRARMVVYWSADMKSVLGLANEGPSKTCRIGKPANGTVMHITSVWRVGALEAIARFESAPWA